MSLYVRKIEKAKWLQNDILNGANASADAITNCTKTKRNTLSVWEIASEQQIDDAILAILGNSDHLDTIDVVCIPSDILAMKELTVEHTPGNTQFEKMVNSHRNIAGLDFLTLGTVSKLIIRQLQEKKDRRYTVGKLKKLVKSAVKDGLATKDSFPLPIIKKVFNETG